VGHVWLDSAGEWKLVTHPDYLTVRITAASALKIAERLDLPLRPTEEELARDAKRLAQVKRDLQPMGTTWLVAGSSLAVGALALVALAVLARRNPKTAR
jgi:adenylosuccinate lyase